MAKSGVLTVNGSDIWTVARLTVDEVDGLDDYPAAAFDRLSIVGRDGVTITSARKKVEPRLIKLTGTIDARGSNATTLKDALADLLERDDLTLAFPLKRSGMTLTANLDGPRGMRFFPPSMKQTSLVAVELNFLCAQPYWTETAAQAVTGIAANTDTTCDVGTAPSDVTIVINGSAATPALIHADSASVEIGRIELLTIAGGSTYRITTTNGGHVEVNTGSGYVNGMANITNANYTFPDLQPKYGTRATAAYQKIKSTTGTLDVSFYRRWR
jgi:phage-related protein